MTDIESYPTRRSVLTLLAAALLPISTAPATDQLSITVHKDQNCGCCSGWVRHLQENGFAARIVETTQLDAVRKRLGVPDDLAACHTAILAGYVVEGHVPVKALKRILAERPQATGLAVPGMPGGSPGMSGPEETYEVVLFGPTGQRTYMRFSGDREV